MVFQSGDEEWVLMSRVASGDESALAELYDRFGALVFKTARQVLTSRAESEDASQEIFVRLWKTADRFDPRKARLVTWVMLISRRYLIDRLRRKVARPEVLGLEAETEGVFIGAGKSQAPQLPTEENYALKARIQELPALQREVIERAYLHGFTLREVSEQLNAPLGTIKSALSRGLARMRERMSDSEQNTA